MHTAGVLPNESPKCLTMGCNLGREDGSLLAWGNIYCGVIGFSPTSSTLSPSRGLNIKNPLNSLQCIFTLQDEEQSGEGSSEWAPTDPKADNIVS